MYLMIYLRNKRSYRQHPIGVLLCSSVGRYVCRKPNMFQGSFGGSVAGVGSSGDAPLTPV